MSGAIPPLPNSLSWRGAPLKHRDNFTFTFYLYHTNFTSPYRQKNGDTWYVVMYTKLNKSGVLQYGIQSLSKCVTCDFQQTQIYLHQLVLSHCSYCTVCIHIWSSSATVWCILMKSCMKSAFCHSLQTIELFRLIVNSFPRMSNVCNSSLFICFLVWSILL
jgi:hypothetical protein